MLFHGDQDLLDINVIGNLFSRKRRITLFTNTLVWEKFMLCYFHKIPCGHTTSNHSTAQGNYILSHFEIFSRSRDFPWRVNNCSWTVYITICLVFKVNKLIVNENNNTAALEVAIESIRTTSVANSSSVDLKATTETLSRLAQRRAGIQNAFFLKERFWLVFSFLRIFLFSFFTCFLSFFLLSFFLSFVNNVFLAFFPLSFSFFFLPSFLPSFLSLFLSFTPFFPHSSFFFLPFFLLPSFQSFVPFFFFLSLFLTFFLSFLFLSSLPHSNFFLLLSSCLLFLTFFLLSFFFPHFFVRFLRACFSSFCFLYASVFLLGFD